MEKVKTKQKGLRKEKYLISDILSYLSLFSKQDKKTVKNVMEAWFGLLGKIKEGEIQSAVWAGGISAKHRVQKASVRRHPLKIGEKINVPEKNRAVIKFKG